MVAAPLKIGEVAGRSGLTVKTIRFYCDEGLIHPISRSEGGYRLFGDDGVPRRVEYPAPSAARAGGGDGAGTEPGDRADGPVVPAVVQKLRQLSPYCRHSPASG
ncbi:MAG: MerR family DNA-binding transcriptional regulator [Synechococcaceae bacterium WB6_1A_059]|nr:MerR family DNA-binding transcriptional regulator [Synechococcaceae bacterium WB6_1A_059]